MAGHKWQKGEPSPNPNGRPLKNRALTDLLEKAGNKTLPVGERRVARKRVLSESAWQLLTEGKTTLPNGTELELAPKDWLELFKWLYQHIDGTKQKSEVTGTDGGPVNVVLRWSNDNSDNA